MPSSEPMELQEAQLSRVGVEIVSGFHGWLKCVRCGKDWVVEFSADGNLPSGFWNCPGGCNVKR